MPQQQQGGTVELEEIRAAVKALKASEADGKLSSAETTRRINDCRRAVTQRDLWKASGGPAGSPKRSDWKDIRGAVYGLLFLLALAVVGVYFITVVIGEYVGGEEFVPGMTISPGPPT
jgi:hypothetical protein